MAIVLPTRAPAFTDEDGILCGDISASGTTSNFLRLRKFLVNAGFDVLLAAQDPAAWRGTASVVGTKEIAWSEIDCGIVHPWEWVPRRESLPDEALPKTALWLQNLISLGAALDFFRAGGWRLVTPTSTAANTYRAIPAWRRRVTVVPNWYDDEIFIPSSPGGTGATSPVFLYVGAVGPAKGFVELMEIWRDVAGDQPAARLHIAGTGALHSGGRLGSMGLAEERFERDFIAPWLRSFPAEAGPVFLGAMPARALRAEIVAATAVIVNPSRAPSETFCVAAVEAQACGRPVVTVAHGGLRDTLAPELRRRLPGPGEWGRLTAVLQSVCRSPAMWAELGKECATWSSTRFGASQTNAIWLSFLEGGLGEPIEGRGDLGGLGIAEDVLRTTRATGLAMDLVRRLRRARSARDAGEKARAGER